MSSKSRETFSVALLALSIGIQLSAPLCTQAQAIASSSNVAITGNQERTSNLIANKDDDDDDDDDEDDDKDREKDKDRDKDKSKEQDQTNQSVKNDTVKTETHASSASPDSPPGTESTGFPSETNQPSGNSGGNSQTVESTAPSWNDASETRNLAPPMDKTKGGNDKQGKVDKTPQQSKSKTEKSGSEKSGAASTNSKEGSASSTKVKATAKLPSGKPPEGLPPSFYIDTSCCRKTMETVDSIVCKRLYSKKLAQTAWKEGLLKNREAILDSKTLRELGGSMGAAFAALKSSHCNFVTANDEMYHFLHALFSDFNKKLSKGKIDCVGFVTGWAPFDDNQIRYILDGSPAARAGLKIGDRILKVNGLPYVGYMNFLDTAGKNTVLSINRNGESKSINIKSEKEDLYTSYIDAMKKSVRIEQEGGKKIGYVHVWSGGRRSFEALDEIMEDKLGTTDGLIFDLRDGYGGNSLNDLDRFYRSPKAYPNFETVDRNGKKNISRYYYDKPMVVLINGGSRSGKELLSFSFKRTGRAKLVGTKTAGAVLAGSLYKVNDTASVYVAVLDGTVDGVRLEGVGVAPDVEIENESRDQAGYEKQLSVARQTLLEQLKN